MKLYEIKQQLIELNELVEQGELPVQAIQDTFEALEGEFNDKAISCVHYLQNLNSEVDSIDAEIKRLTAMKKARQNAVSQFKEYMRVNMTQAGIDKIECPLFKITLSKPRKVVSVSDIDLLPEQFKRVKVEPDKTLIKKALDAGELVDGAELSEGKPSLMIK